MIKPTIGRQVWFYPAGKPHTDQPWPCSICYVHSDTMINVGGFNDQGIPFAYTSVELIQDADSYGNPGGGAWACWMPYQKAVASGQQAPTLHA